MKLPGRPAVVTGAGSGIGKASPVFGQQGAHVVIPPISSAPGAEATAPPPIGRPPWFWTCGRQADWERLVRHAKDECGGIDVLANVAGVVAGATDTVVERDEDEWQRILDVDLRGLASACGQSFRPIARGGGRIVNVASMAGLIGLPNWRPLCRQGRRHRPDPARTWPSSSMRRTGILVKRHRARTHRKPDSRRTLLRTTCWLH